jgi:hypothetical protein
MVPLGMKNTVLSARGSTPRFNLKFQSYWNDRFHCFAGENHDEDAPTLKTQMLLTTSSVLFLNKLI